MKTDYKKIDIYLKNRNGFYTYECSTNWSSTCKEAKAGFLKKQSYLDQSQVRANFS